MREKLIKLLSVVTCPNKICNFCEHFENGVACERHRNEVIADHLIANGVTVQEWIPVSERLPFAEYGESDDVLAITELGVMRTLYFDGGNWCFQNGECCPHKVTHWMPLPPAPEDAK